MREILFRGKRIDNGEWVYGCYVKMYDYEGNVTHHISPPWCKVDPETVGQYTGLDDKGGKKIFEGDILTFKPSFGEETGIVGFDAGAFYAGNYCLSAALFYGEFDGVVIGNEFDNPELIGGVEDG